MSFVDGIDFAHDLKAVVSNECQHDCDFILDRRYSYRSRDDTFFSVHCQLGLTIVVVKWETTVGAGGICTIVGRSSL